MTRKSAREIENILDKLEDTTSKGETQTRAELGVTAEFVHFDGEELDDVPAGWTWNTEGRFNTAVREDE